MGSIYLLTFLQLIKNCYLKTDTLLLGLKTEKNSCCQQRENILSIMLCQLDVTDPEIIMSENYCY